MPDKDGATTGDASQPTVKKNTKAAFSSADAQAAQDGHSQTPEAASAQFKAAQKFLDEVSPPRSKTVGGFTGGVDNITIAVLPDVAPAPAQAKPAAIEQAQAAPAGTSTASAPLDHHDAAFFNRDLLHSTERVANVWGNSFSKYMKQGILDAGKENLASGEWADKFVSGAMIGVALRTILPKKGVVRAVAGTVMAVNMAKDLIVPFYEGAVDAVHSKDDKDLDDASRKVSKGVGNFVVDNAIGLPAAGIGEAGTGMVLESRAPRFEAAKTEFFTSNKSTIGRTLNNTAATVDIFTSRISEAVKPLDPAVVERMKADEAIAKMTPDEKAARLEEAGKHSKAHFERAEFYRIGPRTEHAEEVLGGKLDVPDSEKPITFGSVQRLTGEATDGTATVNAAPRVQGDERISFSSYVTGLIEGKESVFRAQKPAQEFDILASIDHARASHEPSGPHEPRELKGITGPATPADLVGKRAPVDEAVSPDHLGETDGEGQQFVKKGRKKGGDKGTDEGDANPVRSKGKAKGEDDNTGSGKDKSKVTETKTVSNPREDLNVEVFEKIAKVAKTVQEQWTPEKIKLADARDQFEGPITAATELNKAPLPPEYSPSTMQLKSLIGQIDNVKSLKDAGMFLMYHMKAANQLLFQQDNVRDLNMFTHELAGVFLTGMRKLGIPEDRLRRIIPSLVTETNDGGSGYFTNPPVDGMIDRPVTIVPRAFTRLISVMSDVIRHEALGHDHTYPELARFPEADRDNLIRGAVSKTMKEANVPEKMHKMGGETIPTSELFFRLLKAEANENTSDFMGTASGGIGTPASLGVLLQSLRDGGLLETRNVYGKEFEDGIEPHGIDRWRIKFCAEVMRQLAPTDKVTNDYANALDLYAKEASRPGKDYTWASTDNPGEKVDIPMEHWDAIIPRIVKAQLDTPLDTLKDVNGNKHTLREMLGEQHANIVKGIDELANQFVDAIHSGKTELPAFDKKKYTIGQVFSAGLVAWMRATSHDVDPEKSLAIIDKISSSLRAQYRESNPNEVPLTTPTTVKIKQTLSLPTGQIARVAGAALIDAAPKLRTGADRTGVIVGGSNAGHLYHGYQWLRNEMSDMASKKKEVLGIQDADLPPDLRPAAEIASERE